MLPDGLRLGFGALNIYIAQDYNIEWKKCKKFNIVHAHLENQEKNSRHGYKHIFGKILSKSWKDTYQIHDNHWDWI